ncbi:MAG: hypothetical protein HY741_07715 [Chloroflexi bacterium]|nr:hypothetical protein [Chloroflexota bacterium]
MMPFTPMDDNVECVVENLTEGLPEEGAPAAQGGIGAVTAETGETGQVLKQEGVLDETTAEESES